MLFSSKKESGLLSPCTGKVVSLSEIPDEVFASGMLGSGFGVLPTDGKIFSPASGRVESVAEGKHAYTLVSDEGLELLVHIGVDTVELEGAAFSPRVVKGTQVMAGDLLAVADLSMIREKKLSDAVAVLVTNTERIEAIEYQYGACVGGESRPMRFRIRRK